MWLVDVFGGRKNCIERTERAVRFTAFGVLAFWLSVSTDSSLLPGLTSLPLRFLSGFVFCCMSALTPPMVASVTLICSVAYVGMMIGLALVTALLYIVQHSIALVYVLLLLLAAWLCTLRTGRTAAITNVAVMLTLYIIMLAFFEVYPYMVDGVYLNVPMSQIRALLNQTEPQIIAEIDKVQNMLGLPVMVFINDHRAGIEGAIVNGTQWTIDWRIEFPYGTAPAFVEPIIGEVLHASLSSAGLTVGIDGGNWLINVMWTGDGKFSIMEACLINFSIGISVFALSLICPPQRRVSTLVTRKLLGDACAVIRKVLGGESGGGNGGSEGDGGNGDGVEAGHVHPAVPSVTIFRLCQQLTGATKFVFMASLEPYLLYPGPAASPMRPLEGVRMGLTHAMWAVKHEIYDRDGDDGGVGDDAIAQADAKKAVKERKAWIWSVAGELETLLRLEPSLLYRKRYIEARDKSIAAMQELVKSVPAASTCDPIVHALLETCKCVDSLYDGLHNQSLRGLLGCLVVCHLPALAMIGRLITSLVSFFVSPFKPKLWVGRDALWRDAEVQWLFKMLFGWALIVALPLWSSEYRSWSLGVSNTDVSSASQLVEEASTTKITSWVALGFLTTFHTTYEGCVHRVSFRAAGTLIGAFSAWIILQIVSGPDHPALVLLWCLVVIFIDVWLCAHPQAPLTGFHPELNYAAQVLMYTQMYITLSDITGDSSGDYLVASRILGNFFGMGIGLVLAYTFPVISADDHVRILLSYAFEETVALLDDADAPSDASAGETAHAMKIARITDYQSRAARLYEEGSRRRYTLFGKIDYRLEALSTLIDEFVHVVTSFVTRTDKSPTAVAALIPLSPEVRELFTATQTVIACRSSSLLKRSRNGGSCFDRSPAGTTTFQEASRQWLSAFESASLARHTHTHSQEPSAPPSLFPVRPLVRIALAIHTELSTVGVYEGETAFQLAASVHLDHSARQSTTLQDLGASKSASPDSVALASASLVALASASASTSAAVVAPADDQI